MIENIKTFFLSIIFAIFILCYFVSFGMLERFSIIMITLFIYTYIRNIKKITMKCHCTVFTGIVLGIILCSYILFFFEYKNDIKKEPSTISKNENTAVLLLFDGEPERYDLPVLLKNMHTNDNLKNRIYIPFRLYQYKRAYEHIGISRYNDISKNLREKLLKHLDEGYDVYVAYLNNKPYYKEIIYEKIIKENYSKVIVAPIFLTESKAYKRAVYDLEMENLYASNGMLKFMSPLWDSEKTAKSIVKQVCKINSKKNEVGIVFNS
ncbi:ferrochelatase [Crassaminicella thermophila]|nr:ferrochelatase [Crassaminicella thermophila]